MLQRATLINALAKAPAQKAVVKMIDLLPAKGDVAIQDDFTAQTTTAEKVHRDVLMKAGVARLRGWLRWTFFGILTAGSTAVTFTVRLRCGGLTGVQLVLATPIYTSVANKKWKFIFNSMVKGPVGPNCVIDTWLELVFDGDGSFLAQQVATVDATIDQHLVFTAALSTTTGSPSFTPGAALLETF